MIHETSALKELVAPAELKEVLNMLKDRGDIIDYYIGINFTFVEPSKGAEIKLFLLEAVRNIENPRPFIKNRIAKKLK